MVKRLLHRLVRFSLRSLYGFLPYLQRVSGRVEKKRRKREIVQPCSRSKPELGTCDKGNSKVEMRDKPLELMIHERTRSTKDEIISEAAVFELPRIPSAVGTFKPRQKTVVDLDLLF